MGRIETKFKQTEVGLIPVDWEVKTISDCCKIFGRIGFRGYTINDIVEEGFGSITISPSNIIDGKVNFDKCTYLSWFKYEESPEIKIFNGDILLVKTGSTFGKTAIVKGLNLKATINPQIVVLKNIEINRILLGYIMGFNDVQNYIKSSVVGGAIPTLSQKQILNFKIFVPPTKTEQTAIANALSDADGYIESLEKLIDKKQKIKQGSLQQLLKPKPHWEFKCLGQIGEIIGAGVDKEIKEKETPVRLVNYMDVFKKDFIYSNDLNHWVTAPQSKILKYAVKQGDIFFTPSSEMRFDIAISAVAMENIPDAVHSYHLIKLRLFQDWDLQFRTYIFKTNYFLNQAEQICEGSGKRYVITLPKFRNLNIYYPPNKDEQIAIAQTLSDIDNEIATLTQKLTKAKAIKQGMMQQLLTGKIRLI